MTALRRRIQRRLLLNQLKRRASPRASSTPKKVSSVRRILPRVRADHNRIDDITSLDFSQVPPYKEDFDLGAEKPVAYYNQGHIKDKVYAATMAIQNLPFNEWIALDQNYKDRMELKKEVIQRVGAEVMNCLPPGYDGCVEHLEMLVEYLPRRYPTVYTMSADKKKITNTVTDESFDLRPENFNKTDATNTKHPLYIAGRLIEDDISILTIPSGSDEYVLQAALFGFPAGFHIDKKIGLKLTDIHGPVPTYESKLKIAMNRFFKNVGPSRMVMRVNWGINDRLELHMPDGGHLYEDDDLDTAADESIDINQCQLRIERQVLRRLPRTKALAFLAKTYVYPITELAKEPGFAKKLAGLLHKLPEKFAFYKRKPVWGKIVIEYLDEMAEKYPGVDEQDE